jgi:hypothetical protein
MKPTHTVESGVFVNLFVFKVRRELIFIALHPLRHR